MLTFRFPNWPFPRTVLMPIGSKSSKHSWWKKLNGRDLLRLLQGSPLKDLPPGFASANARMHMQASLLHHSHVLVGSSPFKHMCWLLHNANTSVSIHVT